MNTGKRISYIELYTKLVWNGPLNQRVQSLTKHCQACHYAVFLGIISMCLLNTDRMAFKTDGEK